MPTPEDSICERNFGMPEMPSSVPGHTITMNLSTVEPLVMSVFVVQDSNISSPIDAVSLIASDIGTKSTSVASPSITTSLNNDLLIGFSKVSAGATFTAGAGFTLTACSVFRFPGRRDWHRSFCGELRCGLHAQLTARIGMH